MARLVLLAVALLAGAFVALGLAEVPPSEVGVVAGPQDEQRLRDADAPTDGPGLLAWLRLRVPKDDLRERIASLVRKLGDDGFDVREQACRELIALGSSARPALLEAVKSVDAEVASRAERCLFRIGRASEPDVLSAAVRVLASRKTEGGAAVLLGLLPAVEDPCLADEIVVALGALAVRDGLPDPAVEKALTDREPARRAAAGEALALVGPGAVQPAVHKLLRDPDALVRRRVALGLVQARRKEGVPALISLLSEVAKPEAERLEETLYQIAGDRAPPADDGADGPGRRTAWEAWWRAHGEGVDLRALEAPRYLGRTLISLVNNEGRGEVQELDRSGRVLWRLGGFTNPIDAQVVGEDRVLVCDYAVRTVSERTFSGRSLWEKSLTTQPLGARRLPGGRTFVVTRARIAEYGPDGKEVRAIERPRDIVAACRFRDGQVAVAITGGRCVRYNAADHEVRTFPVGLLLTTGTNIEALPGGHVLVPLYSRNQIVEFDADGKPVWTAHFLRPVSVHRLPSGHVLAASRSARVVIELDRTGEEVGRVPIDGRPLRARRR